MPSHRIAFARSAVVLAVAAALALPGCAVVDELAYNQKASTFETLADAPDDSVARARWVPADAHDIRIVETVRGETKGAAMLLESSSPLDPAICVEVDRASAPDYAIDGAPDAYEADTVFACGAWSVIPGESGWFGWTPNHPDEQAQSPVE